MAAHRDFDAPILRQAALGNVQLCHNLDARTQRGAHRQRQRLDRVQHAVDAVAHANAVLARLDMNIGGLGFDRFGDEIVDELDNRRLARHVFETANILKPGVVGLRGRGEGVGGFLGVSGAVQPLDAAVEFASRS